MIRKRIMCAKNVGEADRIIRIVLGLAIIGVGVYYESLWGLIGLVVLGTGIFRYCLFYSIFGASTCKVKPVSGETNGDTLVQQ